MQTTPALQRQMHSSENVKISFNTFERHFPLSVPPLWWSRYASALLFLECYIRGWADGWSRLVLAEIQQATAVPSRREEWARPQRCGWPSGQLSQKQYCSGTQGGLYPSFGWSYLVSSSCCLLVISAWVTYFKAIYRPLFFSSHTLSTCLQDKQTSNQPLLTSACLHRWTPAIQCNICFSFSLYCVFSLYLITGVRCENSVWMKSC